ncbi:MAG: sulfonate superfamily binding cassette transporter, permease protein [Enterovirga sp.]|jgi:NitT/TauT family transport system permease protein|nr:sulfonate superfamily binding cassette transporter, permease protein [Enterovirga sp.]
MGYDVSSVPLASEAPAVRRKPLLKHRKLMRRLSPYAVIVGFFLIWELICRVFGIEEFVLPAPTAIMQAGWQFREPIAAEAWHTLFTTLIGFAIAVVVGLLAGTIIGSSSLIYEAFYPVLIGLNSVPKVAVVPILVLWFGIGTVPAIITAFLISFFPILVNVATGIATVEPELKDVLRALGAKQYQVIMKVGLPRSMPYFFASLKIAISVAFVGSILAETVGSDKGIGQLMLIASSRFQVPLAFAGLVVTGAMGIGMYVVAALVEQRMTRWATRSFDTSAFAGG